MNIDIYPVDKDMNMNYIIHPMLSSFRRFDCLSIRGLGQGSRKQKFANFADHSTMSSLSTKVLQLEVPSSTHFSLL